ncbi:TetR/AcrR family transcriptional regulator [Paenirhodobacter populi]|uniref:TetR/AcrR family transcriptional regulator n=1 Tax=Paenirhodobacter populi TaxID=2306993 RepID=A0A443J6K8_9RHOB|nr:TetR/AcrR family transcriptional regulator [Sinirhodobacter populi]RWR16025.1 TetR/AcrR family transcriptional regulator [Sinirhodobacter populi]
MSRPRGRPGRDAESVSSKKILAEAIHLLGTVGSEGFTMRSLAACLGVNPMTIYHHFGDRDGLISAMADLAYSGVSDPKEGTPRTRIEEMLLAYHARVLSHPDLTLLIFAHPKAFPQEALRITESIRQLLIVDGMTPQRSRLWVGILVDFTHGAAIAVAMAMNGKSDRSGGDMGYDYRQALSELMNGLRA